MTYVWEERECDVLVVGAGAAGLRAAVAAAEGGARVALACKSLLGKAGTVLATTALAASSEEAWASHASDTLAAAAGRGDARMADIAAREAPRAVIELEGWDALFERACDGRAARAPLRGHSEARGVQRDARIGLEVLRALQFEAVRAGADVHMECSIHRLFVTGDRIAGALGVRRADGAIVLFRCAAVVLAAGSAARAWKKNTASADATGDALALALDAGAELADMDLVQFERDGACRHGLGGVRVDAASAASCIPGLYAAGDAAAGLHGAQALEGNALAGALVFGRRAGLHAAAHARIQPRRLLSVAQIEEGAADVLRPLQARRGGGDLPYGLLAELQDCMHLYAGPLRSARGLEIALGNIAGLKARAAVLGAPGPRAWNPAWQLALELRSLLAASEATVLAACERVSDTTDIVASNPGARRA